MFSSFTTDVATEIVLKIGYYLIKLWTSAAPLVACSSTDQTFSHHIQNEINWQPGLPTSPHPRLSTSMHTAIIGLIVTYCTSDDASAVSESVQR